MARTTRIFRHPALAAAGLAALLILGLLAGPASPPAHAAEVSCPKFRVMHNDRIGKVSFPAGYYSVTLLNGAKLTCAQSTKLFAEFLQDWDGKLRKPWVLTQSGKDRIFSAGKGSDLGFRARPSSGGGGGGGGGGTRMSCPGYFSVVHNDSIGSFKVPRGRYRLTLLDNKRMTCARAFNRFREFLEDFDGILPKPWHLNRETATFTKGPGGKVGFNINRAYGPSPHPGRDKRLARCPATFRVLHNDRIGRLNLPKGPYYILVSRKPALSCGSASNYFRQFLNRTDGRLPYPWQLNVGKARFQAGPGGVAFRVEKA